jgi:Rod binding domain-containing protein
MTMQAHVEPARTSMPHAVGVGGGHAGAGPRSGAAQPKLVNAAHEFEAQMMKELMKPLTKGAAPGDADEEDDDSGDSLGSAGALGEFASEAMARALSEQGGFGIADRIIAQLSKRSIESDSRDGNDTEASRAAGNAHEKAKIKPLR